VAYLRLQGAKMQLLVLMTMDFINALARTDLDWIT
jgi:hypothetical protein